MRSIYLAGVAALAFAIAGRGPAAAQDKLVDASLRQDLERVSQRSIFFGHQSVGDNILDGLNRLGASAGVPLRIAAVSSAGAIAPGNLGHVFVGENRNPLGKLKAFERAFAKQPSGVDIAVVKLCYLDFTPETDATRLFEAYRSTLTQLKRGNPGTVFVHVTTPLTQVESGVKALVKRVLGRAPYGMVENLRRAEYNELLRKEYAGKEPLFDLARLESIAPDGAPQTAEWNGKTAPVLAAAYTSDGGHLNDTGKLRAARELVSVLARVR
jgi:hypothetical protein